MANVETIERPKRKQTDADTLWAAFAAAQAEFGPIIKGTKGARGNYAPLDTVLETVRPILNKNGLALTQATFVAEGTLYVRSSVVHVATGEMHCAEYPAGALTLQHQQLGAGVTYARRYSLLSILGVFPENEDDDGEKAGAAGGASHASPPPRQQQTNASQAKKADVWPRFVEKLRSFEDLDELERWWSSASTQAAVDAMPGQWPEQAAEEYEKKQEALMSAGRP
jgi:hypothetical protein